MYIKQYNDKHASRDEPMAARLVAPLKMHRKKQ